MKKAPEQRNEPEMRAGYDFSHGVRGKHARRYAQGTNVVVLEPDVADVFPTAQAVHCSLRALADIIRRQKKPLASEQARAESLVMPLHSRPFTEARTVGREPVPLNCVRAACTISASSLDIRRDRPMARRQSAPCNVPGNACRCTRCQAASRACCRACLVKSL